MSRLNTSGTKRDRAQSQGSFGLPFEKRLYLEQSHYIDRDERERVENEYKER